MAVAEQDKPPIGELDRALRYARESYLNKRPGSVASFEQSVEYMPGGNTRTVLFHGPVPLRILSGNGCRITDADGVEFDRGLSLYDPGLALQAAADGLGVAMGYIQLAQRELADGRLIAPLDLCIEHPWSYYVVTAKGRRPSAAAEAFMNWLFTESDQATTGTCL